MQIYLNMELNKDPEYEIVLLLKIFKWNMLNHD